MISSNYNNYIQSVDITIPNGIAESNSSSKVPEFPHREEAIKICSDIKTKGVVCLNEAISDAKIQHYKNICWKVLATVLIIASIASWVLGLVAIGTWPFGVFIFMGLWFVGFPVFGGLGLGVAFATINNNMKGDVAREKISKYLELYDENRRYYVTKRAFLKKGHDDSIELDIVIQGLQKEKELFEKCLQRLLDDLADDDILSYAYCNIPKDQHNNILSYLQNEDFMRKAYLHKFIGKDAASIVLKLCEN